MTTILTETELIKEWKLSTAKELKVFRRMLNPNLPARVCPRYIDPKDIIHVGDSKRFYFDPEAKRPKVLRKPQRVDA